MSVFIQFLLDNLAFVIITGLVILGILGVGTTLVILTIKNKRHSRRLKPETEAQESDQTK